MAGENSQTDVVAIKAARIAQWRLAHQQRKRSAANKRQPLAISASASAASAKYQRNDIRRQVAAKERRISAASSWRKRQREIENRRKETSASTSTKEKVIWRRRSIREEEAKKAAYDIQWRIIIMVLFYGVSYMCNNSVCIFIIISGESERKSAAKLAVTVHGGVAAAENRHQYQQ